jgi:hypothetical protein
VQIQDGGGGAEQRALAAFGIERSVGLGAREDGIELGGGEESRDATDDVAGLVGLSAEMAADDRRAVIDHAALDHGAGPAHALLPRLERERDSARPLVA